MVFAMSRLLVVMGSGETTPGMLGVHREVFGALGGDPTCVMLDSPFAFQDNRQELVERIGAYFAESLGHPVGATGCRIMVTLIHAMKKRGKTFGLATLCGGGGVWMQAPK